MADITPQERFRGCLLAGAAGDALGAPVEFMSRADILRHFSAAGITAFAPVMSALARLPTTRR